MQSSTLDIGNEFRFVSAFSLRFSSEKRNEPSFFGANETGTVHFVCPSVQVLSSFRRASSQSLWAQTFWPLGLFDRSYCARVGYFLVLTRFGALQPSYGDRNSSQISASNSLELIERCQELLAINREFVRQIDFVFPGAFHQFAVDFLTICCRSTWVFLSMFGL